MKSSYSESTTETFWTRNVRIITFVICITVFLVVAVLIGHFWMFDYKADDNADKPLMRTEELLELAARKDVLTLRDLEPFRYESSGEWVIDDRTGKTVFLFVENDSYMLTVMEEIEVSRIVYMVLSNTQTNTELDLLAKETTLADIADFMKMHANSEQ